MRKKLLMIALIMLVSFSLYAIDFVVKNPDGSFVFKCEINGSVSKIIVKNKGNGKYLVITRGKGFSGEVVADNETDAAKQSCKPQN
ncbi:MAG: hypothetical protein OEY59_04215 [Deltaproteobacteria bacterium]|nr:hypothetical protein [Deltaproteobacteria bacterium]